ncbi:MAG: hypothetical protein J0L73_02810 [Verrucomicrobia bacterium]|nr:hypothetical protein [Verrucomicrobiota bacterium]
MNPPDQSDFDNKRKLFDARIEGKMREDEYRKWCLENKMDPDIEESRESYAEFMAETGDDFWRGQSDEDREGYET